MAARHAADPTGRDHEGTMPISQELTSAARSNHQAAERARRLARNLTDRAEIERVEGFAAELERQAGELEAKAAQLKS